MTPQEAMKQVGENRTTEHQDGFGIEYYLDYQEATLDDGTVAKIAEANDPREKFYEGHLSEFEFQVDNPEMYDGVVDDVIDMLEDAEEEIPEWDKWEWTNELREAGFYVFLDDARILKKSECNMVFEARDAEVAQYYESWWEWSNDGKIKSCDEEIKLALELMGTKFYRFRHWFNVGKPDETEYDKLHWSIHHEFQDLMYGNSSLVILARMSLEEIFKLEDATHIVVGPNTTVGFHSFWNGSGSILGVNLRKGTKLSIEEFTWRPDKSYQYGIDCVHGLSRSSWEHDIEFVYKEADK